MRISVRLTPRAGRDDLAWEGDVLHVWVRAVPVDGAANSALVALLASRLSVSRNAISIIRGHTSRHKTVSVAGLRAAQLRARLGTATPDWH